MRLITPAVFRVIAVALLLFAGLTASAVPANEALPTVSQTVDAAQAAAPAEAPIATPAAMPSEETALPFELDPVFVDTCGSAATCLAECRAECDLQFRACDLDCSGHGCTWNCVLGLRTCYENCDIFY